MKSSSKYDSIRDIIENFRKSGIAYTDDHVVAAGTGLVGVGGGSAGTGIDGVPGIAFSYGTTSELTATTVMGEVIHWAGMPFQGGKYQDYYNDVAMSAAWAKLGIVMSVEQYRRTYPEKVAADTARDGYDFAESRLAHGGVDIKCLGWVTGLMPKYAKP